MTIKAYKITWIAMIDEDHYIEGRSLIYAENEESAIFDFFEKKSSEFKLSKSRLSIQSIVELTNNENGR